MSLYYGSNKIKEVYYGSNKIGKIYYGSQLVYESVKPYIELSADADYTVSLTSNSNRHPNGTVQYSTDAVNWTNWEKSGTSSSAAYVAKPSLNGKFYIRQIGGTLFGRTINPSSTATNLKVSGNLRSLLDANNIGSVVPIAYCFAYLFYNITYVTDVSGLALTCQNLPEYGLSSAFNGCSGLVNGGMSLMVDTVERYGMYNLFYNCTKLTTTPKMKATTFTGTSSFYQAFRKCSKIIEPPSGLRININTSGSTVQYICQSAFEGCTKLEKVVPIDSIVNNSSTFSYVFSYMYMDCTKLKQINKILSGNIVDYQYYRINYSGVKIFSNSLTSPESGYTKAYRVPYNGTIGTVGSKGLNDIGTTAGGTTVSLSAGTTYYIRDDIEIV